MTGSSSELGGRWKPILKLAPPARFELIRKGEWDTEQLRSVGAKFIACSPDGGWSIRARRRRDVLRRIRVHEKKNNQQRGKTDQFDQNIAQNTGNGTSFFGSPATF